MIPRFDPYRNFKDSTTPVGLYARQKWLGQGRDGGWKAAFDSRVTSLLEGQMPDGSWNGSFIQTVRRLFGLHLTVRYPTDTINGALDWLLDRSMKADEQEDQAMADLDGLPFVKGNLRFLYGGMTLFLSTIFGREHNPDITALYENLSQQVLPNSNLWNNHGDINNTLRALVVHPVHAESSATASIVEGLSALQDCSGSWPGSLPFYQTVNALAHLDLPLAEKQLEKAFALLAVTQNEDGSWGDAEKEWNTFLIVHALRNKKVLE
jgi:hypothetical protein